MADDGFQALVVRQQEGAVTAAVETLHDADLEADPVPVAVRYSSLNYKDGLALAGKNKVVRRYPMVPGVDLVGEVLEDAGGFTRGQQVICTGFGLGERHFGGFSQRARLKAEWLVPLPDGMTPHTAMVLGTAGLTAMLCVMALEEAGITPERGPVIVSGASGGVGSLAVALLAGQGFEITAVTGKPGSHDRLRALGATAFRSRDEAGAEARPLESGRWAGAVDTVGGPILARILAETAQGGAVAACGNAGSMGLKATVLPFILRAVRLQGVESVVCPVDRRRVAWDRLARQLPDAALEQVAHEATLADVPGLADAIRHGRVEGRVVVDPNT